MKDGKKWSTMLLGMVGVAALFLTLSFWISVSGQRSSGSPARRLVDKQEQRAGRELNRLPHSEAFGIVLEPGEKGPPPDPPPFLKRPSAAPPPPSAQVPRADKQQPTGSSPSYKEEEEPKERLTPTPEELEEMESQGAVPY